MPQKPDVYKTTCPECGQACRCEEYCEEDGYSLYYIPLENAQVSYPVCHMCKMPIDEERCDGNIIIAQIDKPHKTTVMEVCQLAAGHDGVHRAEGKSSDTQERYRIMWGFDNSDS